MSKHLLHIGFLLAVAALALKAAFMPPRAQATLRPGESAALGEDVLVLKSFEVPKYPSGSPKQYVSSVHVVGASAKGGRPEVKHAEISVNHPLRWRGWWIYQNSYDAGRESYTVLEAVRDPFLPLAALAAVLLLAGAAMLCVHRRQGAEPRGASAPRRVWIRSLRFLAATAVVLLPLWIMGKAMLARELVPALQSPLLVPHVGAYMVAYAFLLFAAFGIGVRFVPFGYFMMTLALVLGAVWGKICWGDWWQYDPKEMWSLATWLVFGAYFHFRHRPAAAKWLLRAGAVLIILTLTWVNFSKLFTGLHSYA
jgi:cytochrome c biogenesis factor